MAEPLSDVPIVAGAVEQHSHGQDPGRALSVSAGVVGVVAGPVVEKSDPTVQRRCADPGERSGTPGGSLSTAGEGTVRRLPGHTKTALVVAVPIGVETEAAGRSEPLASSSEKSAVVAS